MVLENRDTTIFTCFWFGGDGGLEGIEGCILGQGGIVLTVCRCRLLFACVVCVYMYVHVCACVLVYMCIKVYIRTVHALFISQILHDSSTLSTKK